jgi:hypothetical protein
MAVKTIETRAIISAQDRTGSTFSQVANKLRGLENTAAAASRRMDNIARGMSGVGTRMRDRAIETAMVAGATAAFAAPVLSRIMDQASRRQTESLRMRFAGMSPAEIGRTNEEAQRLAGEYKPIGQTIIGKMIKDARTIAGDTEGALTFIEPLLKFRVQLQSLNKGASDEMISEELEKILRAADLMGATKNLKTFTTFIEGVGRAVNVFGDSVPPSSMFSAAQHAGAASTQWSKEFVGGVFPSLIQTMGGDTAGTALGSFFTALVGGRMKVKSAKLLNSLGLIDPKKIVRNKQGDVAGLMPGGLKGSSLALTNPFEYATNVVLPALTKKGITDPQKITETLAGAFSDKNVAKLMTHFILNREQIQRDVNMAKGGMDLSPTASKLMTEDLPTATRGLSEQFNNLAAALGKGVTPQVTNWTNWVADKIGQNAKQIENDPKANARAWIGGGIAAPVLSHLGLSAVGGYFGGAGLSAGFGAMMGATTPLFAAGATAGGAIVGGSAAYNVYRGLPGGNQQAPSGFLEGMADKFDRWSGITKSDSYSTARGRMTGAWDALHVGGARSGILGFGLGGPASAAPMARLEGAAKIDVKIEVSPTSDFLVKVAQMLTASGALRDGAGVTMHP